MNDVKRSLDYDSLQVCFKAVGFRLSRTNLQNRKVNMEKERFDLRNLILMIKEQKQIEAELTLEFDCHIEADDVKPLIKVINYAINYIRQVTDQPLNISLIAGMRGFKLSLMAMTDLLELPAINPKVNEALLPFNAALDQASEPGKYAQLIISFSKEVTSV